MGNRFKLGKNRIAAMAVSALICFTFAFTGLFTMLNNHAVANAVSVSNTLADISYTEDGELKFDEEKLNQLYAAIAGESGANIATVKRTIINNKRTATYAEGVTKDLYELTSPELSANYSKLLGKNTEMFLSFGGITWSAVHATLTRDAYDRDGNFIRGGDVILTLYSTTSFGNSYWDGYTGSFVTNAPTYCISPNTTYPMPLYGTSLIRSRLNGTNYTTTGSNWVDGASAQYATAKNFISKYKDFIAMPTQVEYQEYISTYGEQNDYNGTVSTGVNPLNQCYGDPIAGEPYRDATTGYASSGYKFDFNPSGSASADKKALNSDWQYDYLFLPSNMELRNAGRWQATANQRTYGSGTNYTWTRDNTISHYGGSTGYMVAACYTISGANTGLGTKQGSYYVRPAFHLNLSEIARLFDVSLPETTKDAIGDLADDGVTYLNNGLTYNGEMQTALSCDYRTKLYKVEFAATQSITETTAWTAVYENENITPMYDDWFDYDEELGYFYAINAGSYKVTYALKEPRSDAVADGDIWLGYDEGDPEATSPKSATFTVKPKGLTVVWDFGDATENPENGTYYWVYDGKEHIPTGKLSGICDRENYGATIGLSFTYENTTVNTGAKRHVTAGAYKMTAKLDFSKITSPDYILHAQNNYRLILGENEDGKHIIADTAEATLETAYTIRKRQLKVEWTGGGEFVYDGETHGAAAEIVAGGQGGILSADKASVLAESSFWVEYSSPASSAGLVAPKNVAMNEDGTAVAPWTAAAKLKHINYEFDDDYKCEILIKPKTVKVIWTEETEFVYSGAHQSPAASVEGLAEGDKLDLAVLYNGAANAINADVYTAVASKSTHNSPYVINNYVLDADTVEQNFEIVKRKVTVSWALPDGDMDGKLEDGIFVWQYDGLKHVPVPSVTVQQGSAAINLTLSSVGAGNSAVSPSAYTATAALADNEQNKNYVLDGTANSQQYKIIKRVISADSVEWSRGNHTLVPADLSIDWGVLTGKNTPEYQAEASLANLGGVSWVFTTEDGASAELKLSVEYYLSSGALCNFADGVEWRAGEYYAKLKLSSSAALSFEFADGADTVIFNVVSVSGNKVAVHVIWVIAQRDNGGNITVYKEFDPAADTPFIYNGAAQAPAAIFKTADGGFEELATNDISKNVEAGKYTVYLLPSEQYSFDNYVCEYTVRALKVKLNWTGNASRGGKFEWIYEGREIVPEASFDGDYFDGGMSQGDYRNLLYNVLSAEAVISASGAVNVGTGLTARATISKNFEIVEGTEEQAFDILKYALNSNNISWTGDSDSEEITDTSGKVTSVRWNYDARPHKPNATATVKIYVDGVLQDVVLTLIVSGETSEPGVHKAYAALDGSVDLHGNFSLEDTAGITFNIAAMVISNVNWTGDADSRIVDGVIVWTYDGKAHLPKAYFVPDGKTYDPDDESTFVWLKVEGERTDAGKYIARVTDNFTFTDEDSKTCIFAIDRAPLEVTWKWGNAVQNPENGTYSWVYDGLSHAPEIENLYGVKNEEIDYSISSFTVAGRHESVLTINNKNYKVAETSRDRQSFIIEKADIGSLYEWISDNKVDGAYSFIWQYNGKKPAMGLALKDADDRFILAAGGVEVEFTFEYDLVAVKGTHTATARLVKAQIVGGAELDVENFAISGVAAAKSYEITAFEIAVTWDFGDALKNSETDAYYWVYDGNGHAPTAKYTDWNGNEITVAVDKRVNANTYTETIDLPANCVFATYEIVLEDGTKIKKSTGECSFVINKAPVEVEWRFDENAVKDSQTGIYYWVYDGKTHAPTAVIKGTETALTVSGGATEATNGYIATATLKDAGNYEFKSENDSVCKFDIRVKEVYILWVDNSQKIDGKPFSWIYNNREYKPQAFLAEIVDGELVAIEENGSRIEVTVSGGQYNANVGGTFYTARAEDTFNNYAFKGGENGAILTQKFTILQKSLEDEMRWSDGNKLDGDTGRYVYEYNGLAQGPYVNISGRDFVYEYANAAGKAVSSATETGVYTVTAACADTNYYIPENLATVTVEITAFKVSVLWTGAKDGVVELEYAGYNIRPEACYTDVFGNTVTLDVSVPTAHHTDVGEYEARAAFKAVASNYVLDKNQTVKFKITPKIVTIEWDDEENSCTYDGQPHGADFAATLKNAITADIDGKLNVTYVLKQGNKILTDKEVVNAGSYTVEITLTGDAAKNYKLSKDKYGFRIAKRTLEITIKGEEVNYGSPAPKYDADTILGALTSEEAAVREAVRNSLSSEYTSRSLPKDGGYAIELNVNRLLTLLPNYTVEFDVNGKPVYTGNVVIVKTADGVVYWIHNDVKVIDDEFVFEYNGNEQRLNAYYLQGGKRVDISAEDIAYMLYDSDKDEYIPATEDYVAKNAGTYYLKAADQGGFAFGDSAYVKYIIAPREIEINLNRIENVYGTVDKDGNEIVLLPDDLLQASWSYGSTARPVDGDDFNIIISSNAYDEANKVNGFVQANSYYIYGKYEGSANYSVTFVGADNDEAPADRKDLGVYMVAKADVTDNSAQGTQWFYDEFVIEQYQKYFIRIEDKTEDGEFKFIKFAGDQTAEVKFTYSDPYPIGEAPVPDENESYPNTKNQIGIGAQGEWAINYHIEISNHNVYYGQWHVLIKLAEDYVVIIIEKPYEVQYGDDVPENFTEILVEGGYVTFGGAIDSRDKALFLSIAEAYVPLGYNQLVNNRTPVGEYNILFKLNVPEDSPLSVIYKRSNADEDSNIGKYVIKPRKLTVSWGETNFVYDGETHLCTPVISNWLDSNAVLSMTDIANGKQYTITDGGQLITVTVTTEGDFTSVGGHEITITVNNGNYELSIEDAAKAVSIVNLEGEKGLPKWLMWLIIGLGAATLLAIVIIIILAKRKRGETVYLGAEDNDGFYDDAYNDSDPTGFNDPFYQDK